MDADYEHNPEDIPHLLSSLKEPLIQLCFAYLPPELGHGIRFYLLNSARDFLSFVSHISAPRSQKLNALLEYMRVFIPPNLSTLMCALHILHR